MSTSPGRKIQKNILILCGGNSCRSQMAEGYLRHFSGGRAEIFSAGSEARGIHPLTIKAMWEDGVDISSQSSNTLDEYSNIRFDILLTVCDSMRESCPYFPADGLKFHHDFADPALAPGNEADRMIAFRRVRDEIKEFCRDFAKKYL